MLGFVAEAAGHAAAARFDRAHLEPRHHAEHLLYRRHGIERFLMAMAVQQHVLLHFLEAQPPGPLGEKFLEQEGALGERFRPFDQHRVLIAQRVKARRFQTDDGRTARERRPQRLQQALGLVACFIDHTDR